MSKSRVKGSPLEINRGRIWEGKKTGSVGGKGGCREGEKGHLSVPLPLKVCPFIAVEGLGERFNSPSGYCQRSRV